MAMVAEAGAAIAVRAGRSAYCLQSIAAVSPNMSINYGDDSEIHDQIGNIEFDLWPPWYKIVYLGAEN
jgi:hypothetical protein